MHPRNRIPSFSDFVKKMPVHESTSKKVKKEQTSKPVSEPINESVSETVEHVQPYSEEYVANLIKNAKADSASRLVENKKEVQQINEGKSNDFDGYKIIKDKDETFECKISVKGITLNEARARIVMDSEPWNLTFYGEIHSDGRCVIPLKKGLPLTEGATGKMRLEVIAEDQLFVGWESDFIVDVSKKLNVELL